MKNYGIWGSALLTLGLIALLVAERVIGEGSAWGPAVALAVLLLCAAVVLRGLAWMAGTGAAKRVEALLIGADALIAVALLIYALSTPWGIELMGLRGSAADRTADALAALWPAFMLVGLMSMLFIEGAYRKMPIAEAIELRRVRGANLGGISLALALVFLFAFNYTVRERDEKTDLSYFKTTKPSEGTLKLVKSLGEPLEIVLFYPKVNEVYDQLRPYFDAIDKASAKIKVTRKDHALYPALTEKHRVAGNGYVVFLRGKGGGQKAESFQVGTELEDSRRNLKKLDGNFQKAFAAIAKRKRELYLTAGHRERSSQGAEGDPDDQRTTLLKDALQRSNITTRDYGMAQGLAKEVPQSAPAVAIMGPRDTFLEEETTALLNYVKGGGRLLVLVDPDAEHGLGPLLEGLGLQQESGKVSSERQRMRTSASAVFTNRYSTHPTVTIASRNQGKIASIFTDAGALSRKPGKEVHRRLTAAFPISTGAGFWRDLDGDLNRDSDEPSQNFNMMAAVTVPNSGGEEGRAVVIGDGDFLTDRVIRNPGNVFVFSDVMQWLIGEEQILGDTTTEEDVRIEHTQEEDKIWFYATSFGAPLPLLALGVWMRMRRRRRKETK